MAIAAGAERTLLGTVSASAATTVDFTSIDTSYDEYEIHAIDVRLSVDSGRLILGFSIDNLAVPTYGTANGAAREAVIAGTGAAFDSVVTSYMHYDVGGTQQLGNAAGEAFNGIIKFYSGDAVKFTYHYDNVYTSETGVVVVLSGGDSYTNVSDTIDSFRFFTSAGTITGEFKLYGYVKTV